MARKKSVGKEIVKRLRKFNRDLKAGDLSKYRIATVDVHDNKTEPKLTAAELESFMATYRETACFVGEEMVRLQKQVDNLALLVVRLARKLPANDQLRASSLEYLAREALTPSVLR